MRMATREGKGFVRVHTKSEDIDDSVVGYHFPFFNMRIILCTHETARGQDILVTS